MNFVRLLAGFVLCLTLFAPGVRAQTLSADSKPADGKPSESKIAPDTYQTFYITNQTQRDELTDIQTDLRNMLPKSRLYAIQSQNVISMRGTPEDVQLAQKMISDLDQPRKIYRLNFTLTDIVNGNRAVSQHFSLVAAAGMKVLLRQRNKVPVFTGVNRAENKSQDPPVQCVGAQVEYQDVGLLIEATADEIQNGLRLKSKVSQSSLADDKSGPGTQNPIIRETELEGISSLVLGKPLVLGSLEMPSGERKMEIEVVAELVR